MLILIGTVTNELFSRHTEKNVMKQTILLISILIYSTISIASINPSELKSTEMKISDFKSLFNQYVKYPKFAKQQKIETTVIITFNIEENGEITHIKSVTNKGYNLENEAIRVLEIMSENHRDLIAQSGLKGTYTLPIVYNLE